MNKQWLVYFTDFHLTVIGLLIFLILFAGVLFWTFRPYSKNIYSQIEQFPLRPDNEV